MRRLDLSRLFTKITLILLSLVLVGQAESQLIHIKDGALVSLQQNVEVTVAGGITIDDGATLEHTGGLSTLRVSGDFVNDGTYTPSTFGTLVLFDSLAQKIDGDLAFEFFNLHIDKNDVDDENVTVDTTITIVNDLRIISNTLLILNDNVDLIIDEEARIFPDATSTRSTYDAANAESDPFLDQFDDEKHISTSGSLQSGRIVRNYPNYGAQTLNPFVTWFPIGTIAESSTQRVYSPFRIRYITNESTFNSGAFYAIQCIASQHPDVIVDSVSLAKYWRVTSDNIDMNEDGYNIRAYYDDIEIRGDDTKYSLRLFFKDGNPYVNPSTGNNTGHSLTGNFFYVEVINESEFNDPPNTFNGDWTIGQPEAISNTYYSIADGNWNDASTWSRQGYNGSPSSQAPNNFTENVVFIGDGHTVTLDAVPTVGPQMTIIDSARTGLDGPGRLDIPSGVHLNGDSLEVREDAILAIADPDGITQIGETDQNDGNVRCVESRDYHEDGIYIYNGVVKQFEGSGLPNLVKQLIVQNADTLQLTKNLEIQDTVKIDNGILSLYNSELDQWFTVNGVNTDTTSRALVMEGNSELIVVEFPEKFKAANFTSGTVNFAGDGAYSSTIPSSDAAALGQAIVDQYYNLKISGDRGSNQNITFDNAGEIRVSNELDLDELIFDPIPNADRFVVSGSKFVFNGDATVGSPNQNISTVTNASTPTGSSYRLSFNDLFIRGSGTKTITSVGDTLLIRGDVNIESATLAAGTNNVKILGDWNTTAGSFQADQSSIIFEVDGSTNTIEPSGDSFYDLTVKRISSNGTLQMLSDLRITNDLEISQADLDLNSQELFLEGDFTNSGDFLTNNSTIHIEGLTGDQTFTNNAASKFFNLRIGKQSGNLIIGAGTNDVEITNNLTLDSGNISGRANDKYVKIEDGATFTRNDGFIDGKLRLYFEEDSNPATTFHIGNGSDYTPVVFTIDGFGGAAGYVESFTGVDVVSNVNNYPFLTEALMDNELPDAPLLDYDRQVGRHWTFNSNFAGSGFDLGASRTYDAEFNFVAADTVATVIPGMEYNDFEIRQRDGDNNTGSWYLTPSNVRDPLKASFSGNQRFTSNRTQYFWIGEPAVPTYYSIADGNWSDTLTWSTAGYGSTEISTTPPGSNAIIKIGDGKEVTLDVNHSLDNFRSVTVEVAGPTESPGTLNLQDFVISGGANTTFQLDSGATLKIGHEDGIEQSANQGNIRTANRSYSTEANYEYVGAENPQFSGNGLPQTVANLTINKDIGTTLDFPDNNPPWVLQVEEDLYIQQGEGNFLEIITKLRGDFTIGENGEFDSGHISGGGAGNTRLQSGDDFGGDGGSVVDNTTVAQADTVTERAGFIFNGDGTQNIEWENSPNDEILFNRFSLSKPSGEVISKNDLQCAQLFFHSINRANLNMRDFNKVIDVTTESGGSFNVLRVNIGTIGFNTLNDPLYGYVNGRLIRTISGRRQFPVGTGTVYHPVELTENGTNGRIEVVVTDGNHPDFDSTAINQNTNIQRWWEIVLPAGSNLSANNGDFRVRLIFDNNNPRGGVNPATDYNQYRYIRATDTWTRVDNMSLINRASDEIVYDHNDPGLGGNNIFQDTSQFSPRPSITIMVGEPGPGSERLFYSRQTGNWGNPQTWSLDSLGGPPATDFPDNISNDIVTIGKGHEITLDRATPYNTKATTMENIEGAPTLTLPDTTVLVTRQFVQKDGSKLRIGSPDGILDNSTTQGSIRQETGVNIINYNFNNQNNNIFEYIGTENQVTGNGLPNVVAELTINNTGGAGDDTVTLSDTIRVTGNLTIEDGRLEYDNNSNIRLDSNLINNSDSDALTSSVNNGTIRFRGDNTQEIRGTSTETSFPSFVTIEKAGGLVDALHSIKATNDITFYTNTIWDMEDNTTFTIGDAATFIAENDSFSVDKMVRVSAGPNTATFVKEFTGSGDRYFRFPVGENSGNIVSNPVIYSEAIFNLNGMDYSAGGELELTLRSESPHPNAPPGAEMLRKYWSVTANNISLNGGDADVKFKYIDAEVDGNILDYAPASYRRSPAGAEGWSFILDNATLAEMDTLNKYIVVEGAKRIPDQDWSAGNDVTYEQARSYWSIASGSWGESATWTNDPNNVHNSSITALNIPGFFEGDTVYINNDHIVTYDSTARNSIDFLEIGTTGYTSATGGGELGFNSASNEFKKLVITQDLILGAEGLLDKNAGGTPSIDTLRIGRNFENGGTTANRGIDIHQAANQSILLDFFGTDSTEISGAGNFNQLGEVIVEKDNSDVIVRNTSTSFSNALTASTDLDVSLNSAYYVHDNSASAIMGVEGSGSKNLGIGSTLEIPQGEVVYEDGFVIEQDCSLLISGGSDLLVGNADNEHFEYESNTTFDMSGAGSTMEVAGSFRRRFGTSFLDFSLTDDAVLRVVSEGSDTDPANERGGFDLGESASSFTLGINPSDNATILIEKPMNTVSTRKDNDYFNNASTSTVLGGTIQLGDASLNPGTSNEDFTVISVPPYWNMDVENTYNNDMIFSSGLTTIRGDLTIAADANANLNGQNVSVGGDFTIEGSFTIGNSGTRRVIMNGNPSATPSTSTDQFFRADNLNNVDDFWDFVVNKPNGGKVILDDDVAYPESNLIIQNTLEFSTNNTGIIVADSSDSFNRYVQVGTSSSDLASIQRFGEGHIAGEVRVWFEDGVQTELIPLGTEDDYTPATLTTSSGTGTEGLISFTAFGKDHPDLDPAFLLDDRNVQRYWRILPAQNDPFALGAGRTYDLTLGFVPGATPAGDVRPLATPGVFEVMRRSPGLPTTRPPADWFYTEQGTKTANSTQGRLIEAFSDFVIAEPLGDIFYSIKDGEWNDPTVWSTVDYGGPAETVDFPGRGGVESDQVKIGDGKKVTLSVLTSPRPKVRSVTIEKGPGDPGILEITDEQYVQSISFDLKDSCTVITNDEFGFTDINGSNPNIGAVRSTLSRDYGESRFVYNRGTDQLTGDGPKTIKTIVVDNDGPNGNNRVFFEGFIYNVTDSIFVQDGVLGFEESDVRLEEDMVLNNGTDILINQGLFRLTGTDNQSIVVNNTENDIQFYRFMMQKPSGNLLFSGTNDSLDVFIEDTLLFSTINVGQIDVRTLGNRMIAFDTTDVVRDGQGFVDGTFTWTTPSGAGSYFYPIGVANAYTPATVTYSGAGGTLGEVDAIAQSPLGALVGRIHPTRKINYYWEIYPDTTFDYGTRTANVLFEFPNTEIANLTGGVPDDAVMRKFNTEADPIWQEKRTVDGHLTWVNGITSVELSGSTSPWDELGTFYIGEKAPLTFYSVQDGDWKDHTSWTFSPTHTITQPSDSVPPGEYPNPSIQELTDNVFVGLDHTIKVDTNQVQINDLTVRNQSKLDLHYDATINTTVITGSGVLDLIDDATIAYMSSVMPDGNTLNFPTRNVGPLTTFEFYSNQGNQNLIPVPFGFPNYPNNVLLSNNALINITGPTEILGNLSVSTGSILTNNVGVNSLQVRQNIINSSAIVNDGVIEIGTP